MLRSVSQGLAAGEGHFPECWPVGLDQSSPTRGKSDSSWDVALWKGGEQPVGLGACDILQRPAAASSAPASVLEVAVIMVNSIFWLQTP